MVPIEIDILEPIPLCGEQDLTMSRRSSIGSNPTDLGNGQSSGSKAFLCNSKDFTDLVLVSLG